MKTLTQYYLHQRMAVIVSLALIFGQQSAAQTYLNINFSNSTNKYSILTEVRSITFNGSSGIVIRKTDNSVGTETLNLIKSITLDGSSGGGTALPVEFVSFTAELQQLSVSLKWSTATEMNNHGFEMQRSEVGGQKSGSGAWSKIGFVEGNGNSNVSHEYSFTDHSLTAGKYSYRLKQIDRDGKFTYSKTVETTVGTVPAVFALDQNYPNPFNPSTMISFQIPVTGNISLKVFDAIGREVATLVNEVKEAGTYSATFNAAKLSSGIYFAKLQSGDNVRLKKMLLLK